MTGIQRLLSRLLRIEPGEGRTFCLLALAELSVIASCFVVGRAVSQSLFLSTLPTRYIPYRYIGVTVGVILASSLYARVVGRYRSDLLIVGSVALMIAGVLLFRLLLATSLASSLWVLGALFVYVEILATLTIMQFWTLASEILNAREAKRLFTPITAVGNLGGIGAGALVSVFVAVVGSANLLFVVALLLALYAGCVGTLGRIHATPLRIPIPRSDHPQRGQPSLVENVREVTSTPLLLSIAVVVVLMTMTTNVVNYQFDLTLRLHFANNNTGLSAFLGSFYFWAGLVGLVIQLVATGPVLRRFGLVAGLVALPLSFALGSGLVLASTATLWAVTLTRSSDTVFRYTINDTTFGLLYVPLSRATRARAKVVIDGLLKPVSIGLVGIVFLIVGSLRGISPVPWSVVVLLLAGLWVALILRMKQQYLQMLAVSIRRRRFDPSTEIIDLNDDTTVAIIKATLRQAETSQVLHALSLVQAVPQVEWMSALLPLLEHESPLVRRETLRLLESLGDKEHADLIRRRLTDPDGEVRGAAIRTYCAHSGDQAVKEVAPFLFDPVPVVRGAAILAIIRYSSADWTQQATAALGSMATDPDPNMRAAAADTLGRLRDESLIQALETLMADDDLQVQTHALHAAGMLRYPELLPRITNHLGDPRTAAPATQALLAYGVGIVTILEAVFTDARTPIAVRRQIPRVLGRCPSRDSALILMNNIEEPDDLTRGRIYKSLVRLQAHQVPLPKDRQGEVLARVMAEVYTAYELAVMRADLGGTEVLLDDALAWRQQYAADRIFYLLGLLHPDSPMAQIRAALMDADPRRRANAVELLDTIVARPIKTLLVPLLEGPEDRRRQTAGEQLDLRARPAREWVAQLARGADPWMAACALHSIWQHGWAEYVPLARAALDRDDPLLRETGPRVVSRLMTRAEVRDVVRSRDAEDPRVWLHGEAYRQQVGPMDTEQGGSIMPVTTIERILLLRGVDLFQKIPGEDLALIAQVCDDVTFHAGERFITQGETGNCLYILVDGEARVAIEGVGVVAHRGSREVIGEMALLSNKPRSAHCTALTDITALRIEQADFWDLLEGKPSLSFGVTKVLLARLDEAIANLKREANDPWSGVMATERISPDRSPS